MAASTTREFSPDWKRLGLIELALLIMAIGLALIMRAQIFQVTVRGTFGNTISNISDYWTIIAGLIGLITGIILLGVGLGGRPNRNNVWSLMGLIVGILLLILGLMPFPSWGVGPGDQNSLNQDFEVQSEPALFTQHHTVNILAAVSWGFACLNVLFISLHDLVAPGGSPILPREGDLRPSQKGAAFANSSPPLIKCSSYLRRFVATGNPKHCPGCGHELNAKPVKDL